MKKFNIFLLCFSVLFITSCGNYSLPKSVVVKTGKAEYNFTVADFSGEKEIDLSKKFDIASMISSTGSESESNENSAMKMYSYNPDGTSKDMQIVMGMSLQDIPLDFSQYFQNTDFTTGIEGMTIDKSFTVPALELPAQNAPLTISNLDQTINQYFDFSVPVPAGKNSLTIPLSSSSFDFATLSYKSGKMIIEQGSVMGYTGGSLTGSVKLYYGDEIITQASFVNERAELPLTDVTLYKTGMSIEITGSSPLYTVNVSIDSNSKLASATGITLESIELTVDSQTFDIGDASGLKSCTIGDDSSLTIGIDYPDGWENVNVSYELNVSGGINLSNVTGTVDLKDKVFTCQPITAGGSASISLSNSTIIFGEDAKMNIDIDIKEIKEAVIELQDSFNQQVEFEQDLTSTGILDYIKAVTWNQSGVKIIYSSTLPEGNSINLTTKSDFLGINDTASIVNTSAMPNGSAEIPLYCCDEGETWPTPLGEGAGKFSKIDFNATVTFGNDAYNAENKTLKIVNIGLGKTYTISLEVEPKFDWKDITLNGSLIHKEDKMNTGVNLSSMFPADSAFSDFASKVEFDELQLYLFCDLPNVLGDDDAGFTGKIRAFLGDAAASKPEDNDVDEDADIYLLGSANGNAKLTPCVAPDLMLTEDGKEVRVDFADVASSKNANVAPLINASLSGTNGVLCLDYNIVFTSGNDGSDPVITSEQLENAKNASNESTAIKISAYVVIPFSFNVKDENGIDFDIIKLMGKDSSSDPNWDLLSRTEKMDTSSFDQALDLIDTAAIKFTSSKMPVTTSQGSIKLVVDLDGDGTKFAEQDIPLKAGSIAVNPKDVLELYPMQPTLKLVIPGGTSTAPNKVSFPKEMVFATKLALSITTKEQEVDLTALINSTKGQEE